MGERYTVRPDKERRTLWEGEPPDEIEYEKPEPYTELEKRVIDGLEAAIAKLQQTETHCPGCEGDDSDYSVPEPLTELLRSIKRYPKRITPLTEGEKQASDLFQRVLIPPSLLANMPVTVNQDGGISFQYVSDKTDAGY